MPKFTVSRTLHYTVSELLELEAGTPEHAIRDAFVFDRGKPVDSGGLVYDDISIEEITDEEGRRIYSDHDE
jgi:hypothetical protein